MGSGFCCTLEDGAIRRTHSSVGAEEQGQLVREVPVASARHALYSCSSAAVLANSITRLVELVDTTDSKSVPM